MNEHYIYLHEVLMIMLWIYSPAILIYIIFLLFLLYYYRKSEGSLWKQFAVFGLVGLLLIPIISSAIWKVFPSLYSGGIIGLLPPDLPLLFIPSYIGTLIVVLFTWWWRAKL